MVLLADLVILAELHDEKHQPDIKNGRPIGMPLGQFTNEAYAGLAAGDEQVAIGMAKMAFDEFELRRQNVFQHMIKQMAGGKDIWACPL